MVRTLLRGRTLPSRYLPVSVLPWQLLHIGTVGNVFGHEALLFGYFWVVKDFVDTLKKCLLFTFTYLISESFCDQMAQFDFPFFANSLTCLKISSGSVILIFSYPITNPPIDHSIIYRLSYKKSSYQYSSLPSLALDIL